MKNIEVEIRGRISKEKRDELINFLEKNGKFKKKRERILIDYSTFLEGEGLKDRKRDIRLRVTNKIPEIIVKLGRWGTEDESRKELSVKASQGEFDKLVEIFGHLGYVKGILAIRNSVVYDYNGIEWAIVEVPGHSYYFEAEKLLSQDDDDEKARNKIKKEIEKLGLTPWIGNEFIEYIEELNRDVNEVFDFKEYKENYFKNRFGL